MSAADDARHELRRVRDALGESQGGMARLVGWSPPQISRFESGTRLPGLDALDHLANACGHVAVLRLVPKGADAPDRLTAEESRVLDGFRGLDATDRARVLDYVERLGRCAAPDLLTRVRAAWRLHGVITVHAPVAESLGEPWDVVATSYLGERLASFRGVTEEEALMEALKQAMEGGSDDRK